MEKVLDKIGLEILDFLEKNAKTRIHVIAKKLSLPPSTVHHRIKKMEASGLIKQWTIVKNLELIGFKIKAHVLVFVDVTALKRMHKTQADIAKEIKKISNIEKVDIIAGEADLLVSLRCRNMNEFKKVLLEKIQSIEGITKTKSLIVIAET